MTVIHIKNGTTNITVICSPLSKLLYDSDADHYICQYGDWAYGLFAIVTVIGLFLPLVLIIYCAVKCHNRCHRRKLRASYSIESSFSSQYPASDGDLSTLPYDNSSEHLIVRPHRSKRGHRNKLYFAYPAYGTYDCPSLGGSTASFNQSNNTATAPTHIPTSRPSNTSNSFYVSNSAPVIDSTLQDVRKHLDNREHILQSSQSRRSLNSLNNADRQSSRSLLEGYQNNSQQDSFTESTISSRSSTGIVITKKKKKNPNKKQVPSNVIETTKNNDNTFNDVPESLKTENTVQSKLPSTDDKTSQNFDEQLLEYVLKQPEDQRNGTFLIRESNSSLQSKMLTLYCKSEEKNLSLFYFRILLSEENLYHFENNKSMYKSIDELIQENRKTQSILPCLLGDCLGSNF